MSISDNRIPMVLYSTGTDQYSHRVRLVLAEKRILVKDHPLDKATLDEEVIEDNPPDQIPTLIDRDLYLFHSMVIMEYLDERYPHPPLLPVYPRARAESRLMIHRIEKEWASRLDLLTGKGIRKTQRDRARTELRESIISFAHGLSDQRFLMSNDFTIVDCCAAPVLWRLDMLEITLPTRQTRNLRRYMNTVFSREAFRASLSEEEEEMRM